MKNLLAIFSAFLIFACSADTDDNEAMISGLDYYKFTAQDNSSLLNTSLNKGKTVAFRNQSGETLHYKVVAKGKSRAVDITGTSSGGGIANYYYDKQSVSMESVDFSESANSGIAINVFKNSTSGLKAQFYFDRWNDGGYWGFEEFAISNVGGSLQSLSANGKTYAKVLVIDSYSDASGSGDGFPTNAFKVYYDLNYGIVGFDGVDGKQWRLD